MKKDCSNRDLFGAPGTGVHAWRVFNVAIVDVLLTLLVARLTTTESVPYSLSASLWFFAAFLFHRANCIN